MATVDLLQLLGTPGTNKVMAGELSRLAVRRLGRRLAAPRKRGPGGLLYPFDPALAHVAVNYHRTATRALWTLFESRTARLEPLYEELRAEVAADRRGWLRDGAGISVGARNVGAFAAGERQVVGVVKNALIDGARARDIELHLEPSRPDLLFSVRMHDDLVMVSLDLAGRSLSQRGYRTEAGAAPLREHLAAVLLMLARYDARSELLVDPMCGSGTIAIEGALMAQAAPLWSPETAPSLAEIPALAEIDSPLEPLFGDTVPVVVANEIDGQTLGFARRNAGRAGVAESIELIRGDFSDLSRQQIDRLAEGRPRGLILCNPPYGERIKPDELTRLYRELASWCRQFRGWRAGFLTAAPELELALGRPRIKKPLANGPIRANFYMYDL